MPEAFYEMTVVFHQLALKPLSPDCLLNVLQLCCNIGTFQALQLHVKSSGLMSFLVNSVQFTADPLGAGQCHCEPCHAGR